MLPDVEALADMVVQAIETALGPVVERLAVAEARLAAVGDLRDRVVAVETKAAQPLPAPDLGDVRDRIVALETKFDVTASAVMVADTQRQLSILSPQVADIPAMRERLTVLEATSTSVPISMSHGIDTALRPVVERLAAAEAHLSAIGDLRDRVVAVETTAAQPLPAPDLGDVRDRLVALETRTAAIPPSIVHELQAQVGMAAMQATDIPAIRERLAVLETRAPVAGPAGQNGANGKDGADGLGFEDLAVEYDGDRTLALKFERGDQRKVFPIQLPILKYEGIYQEGREYAKGDVVTWAGSTWHCNEETITKPGDGSKAWMLIVKRGRDGKDGRDGRDAPLPVVKVG